MLVMTPLHLHAPVNVGYDSPSSACTGQCWLWHISDGSNLYLCTPVNAGHGFPSLAHIGQSWSWLTNYPSPDIGWSWSWPTNYPSPDIGQSWSWPTNYPSPNIGWSWSWPTNYPSPDIGWSWSWPTRLSLSRHWLILVMTYQIIPLQILADPGHDLPDYLSKYWLILVMTYQIIPLQILADPGHDLPDYPSPDTGRSWPWLSQVLHQLCLPNSCWRLWLHGPPMSFSDVHSSCVHHWSKINWRKLDNSKILSQFKQHQQNKYSHNLNSMKKQTQNRKEKWSTSKIVLSNYFLKCN